MYEYLDSRYAEALYEIAEEKGKVDTVINDFKEVCEIIENDKQFSVLINHPKIPIDKKIEVFSNLFKGKIDDDVISFLVVLMKKGRMYNLNEKLSRLESIDMEKRNIVKGLVKTAIPLKKEQYETLLSKLEKIYGKKIILEQVVDKSIIGGLYIRVHDEIIDGTLLSRYADIEKEALNS